MRAKRRTLLMTIVVALTSAWALTTFVIYVATQDVPAGWVLATILLYAVLFIAMLVLAFTQETTDEGVPLGATTAAAAIPEPAAGQSTYFATRRGHVEFDRGTQGLADVSVVETDQTLHMDTVEAALDRIEPTPLERGERTTFNVPATTTTNTTERRPAPAGVPT